MPETPRPARLSSRSPLFRGAYPAEGSVMLRPAHERDYFASVPMQHRERNGDQVEEDPCEQQLRHDDVDRLAGRADRCTGAGNPFPPDFLG